VHEHVALADHRVDFVNHAFVLFFYAGKWAKERVERANTRLVKVRVRSKVRPHDYGIARAFNCVAPYFRLEPTVCSPKQVLYEL
jgi:hypothetical protein